MAKETETLTQTDREWKGNLSDMREFGEEMVVVEAPIFIMFAEYLGYVSRFNKLSEEWIDGKVPEIHIQKVVKLEANCIFRQMKNDYPMDEIKYFYNQYYPLIIQEYEEKFAKILED